MSGSQSKQQTPAGCELAQLLTSWFQEAPGRTQQALAGRITEGGVKVGQTTLSRYLNPEHHLLARTDVIREMHRLLGRSPDELTEALELHAKARLQAGSPPGGPEEPERDKAKATPPQSSATRLWTVAVVVLMVLVTGGGVWWAASATDRDPEPPRPTPTPTSTFTFTPPDWPLVREGDRLWKARTVQYLLVAHEHHVEVDGIFGPKTAAAVKEFQTRHALLVDGKVGPKTWPLLVVRVRSQAKGPAVSAVQSLLTNAGLTTGVTGEFTEATARNLSTFQETHRLPVTGEADALTWRALMGAQLPPVHSQPS